MWKNNTDRMGCAHYSIFSLMDNVEGMDAIRKFFSNKMADEMNLILFSTSGVHGSYTTIEEIEENIKKSGEEIDTELTFLIIQPRIVALRYGVCNPKTLEDIEYLKKLRESSHQEFLKIG